MKTITLAGALLILAGCTWGHAVSAVGSAILSGGLPTVWEDTPRPYDLPTPLICHPKNGETVVDPTVECHSE